MRNLLAICHMLICISCLVHIPFFVFPHSLTALIKHITSSRSYHCSHLCLASSQVFPLSCPSFPLLLWNLNLTLFLSLLVLMNGLWHEALTLFLFPWNDQAHGCGPRNWEKFLTWTIKSIHVKNLKTFCLWKLANMSDLHTSKYKESNISMC